VVDRTHCVKNILVDSLVIDCRVLIAHVQLKFSNNNPMLGLQQQQQKPKQE
jgi:hypothetical protein